MSGYQHVPLRERRQERDVEGGLIPVRLLTQGLFLDRAREETTSEGRPGDGADAEHLWICERWAAGSMERSDRLDEPSESGTSHAPPRGRASCSGSASR